MKKKLKKYDKVTEVRAAARENIGQPPPTRRVPNRKRRPEKYKSRWEDE